MKITLYRFKNPATTLESLTNPAYFGIILPYDVTRLVEDPWEDIPDWPDWFRVMGQLGRVNLSIVDTNSQRNVLKLSWNQGFRWSPPIHRVAFIADLNLQPVMTMEPEQFDKLFEAFVITDLRVKK